MTDRQIRCFLALYETLNFSAAARQLFLTQPTLSYQIRTLKKNWAPRCSPAPPAG